MVDPPEKLPNDNAHDAQAFCLPNKMPEFFEHGLQPGAIGQLESLADMLVKRFAQGSAMNLRLRRPRHCCNRLMRWKWQSCTIQPWLVPSLIIQEISSETEARCD